MTARTNTACVLLAASAIALAACTSNDTIQIAPWRIEVVEMADYGPLSHDIHIIIPLGFTQESADHARTVWSLQGGGWTNIALEYGYIKNELAYLDEAKDPCWVAKSKREGGVVRAEHRVDAIEIRRREFPDGFQVMCGASSDGAAVATDSIKRFIRVDRNVLACTFTLDGIPKSSIENAWNVCASVQVRRPHLTDYPEVPWAMELVTFPDGWRGWRSRDLRDGPPSKPSWRWDPMTHEAS